MRAPISPPVLTAQMSLNRRGESRGDEGFIAAKLADGRARVLALFDLKVPILPSDDGASACLRWLSLDEARFMAEPLELAFLGEDISGSPVFACNFAPDQIASTGTAADAMKPLVDLRSLAIQGVLAEAELLAAAQARALFAWSSVNRFCARCGAAVQAADAGWRRHCTACGLDAHPRMDPAVIMLISREDRCLLGHEHRFPDKFYSTLAGFVEPGDDIEHAVRREVKEEAGIEIGEVRYVASQPWPFPHSLMIGCWGQALSEAISFDAREIADARWFRREEVRAMLENRHAGGITVPPPISMAHTLIRGFVERAIGD
jgi:NAD+ diphosphatase